MIDPNEHIHLYYTRVNNAAYDTAQALARGHEGLSNWESFLVKLSNDVPKITQTLLIA